MQYDDENDGWLAFAAGLLIGLVIGAGVGLLGAPQSGRRTRRRLRHAVEDARDSATDRWETLGDDVRSAVESRRRRLKL